MFFKDTQKSKDISENSGRRIREGVGVEWRINGKM